VEIAEAPMADLPELVNESVKPDVQNKDSKKSNIVINGRIDFEKPACKPEYPRAALRNELTGTTTLAVTISAEGTATQVKVIKSSGHVMLDEAVKKPLLNPACKMQPGTVNGVAKKLVSQVQYVWRLDDDDKEKNNQFVLVQGAVLKTQSNTRPAKINFDALGCKPEYPRASLRNEEHGITKLDVHITETGAIDNVQVLSSSKFEGLDNAVREQLLKGSCIAKPALKDGKSVASNTMVTYLWKLD
ncbi:MAG: energy transducer TonB, partial [Burkholderiales bacterium]|nr:energy transducer TonB [Burkholderiales bacterium]